MKFKLFPDKNTKDIDKLKPLIDRINSYEEDFSSFSDEVLRAQTNVFKKRIKKGETLDQVLPEAFAVVRETAKRTLKQRHFDVQLMGGISMHNGDIVEMKTGEGKTLVATLPVYLNALAEKGVHVVTVNDYLAQRDAVWMGQIYAFLGLSVGIIGNQQSYLYDPLFVSEKDPSPEITEKDKERDELGYFKVVEDFLRPCSRTEAYSADVTYGTNNEFGFDYLRDNISYKKEDLRQRGFGFAIVDEIDSILIDEARTPLIISAQTAESENLYKKFTDIAVKMNQEEDYTVDEKFKALTITDAGIEKAEKLLGIENIYTEKGIKFVHHLETAVKAKAIFKKDKDYVVREGEILIVDEFTGRILKGRRYSEGIHQAIESKEGVPIQKETKTFASVTFQNYFRMYEKLAGMTGTAMTSQEEFRKVYGLETLSIPTNKPIERKDHDDLIYQTEIGKFKAISRKVKELNQKGQPVLIGTVSIEKNELLSQFLSKEGVKHEILNAKNHDREAEIVAEAGKKGAVTIATNMAGRGVDIKLGGKEVTDENYEEIKKVGGLFVLGTERHEARRIDDQLRGRAGRQGDPGETQFFVSLEDDLMRVFASDTIKKMMGSFGIPEDEPIKNRLITKALESAQTKIEGFHFDSRKHVLEFDDIMNTHRKTIYSKRDKILFAEEKELDEILENIVKDHKETKDIIEGKIKDFGVEQFLNSVKLLMLQVIDMLWVDHLEMMDYTRSSVNLRAYGQRDPLVEYKKEGLKLFRELEISIDETIIKLLPNLGGTAVAQEQAQLKETHENARIIGKGSESNQPTRPSLPLGAKEKVGRNDPCPCGSGKKYKKCHGI